MSENPEPPPSEKKVKERSPSYPAIGLRKALEYSRKLWDHDKRQATLATRAAVNLGFSPKSSGGMLALAAMKKFGLLIEEGTGETRKVRLSDDAIGLLNPSGANRNELLKSAALKPSIYADLWEKFGADGASNGTVRDWLVFDRKFYDDAVKILIPAYKDTIALAGLTASDTVEDTGSSDEDDDSSGKTPMQTDTLTPPPPAKPERLRKPAPGEDNFDEIDRPPLRTKHYRFLLDDDAEVELKFSGRELGADQVQGLIDYLGVMKARLTREAAKSSASE